MQTEPTSPDVVPVVVFGLDDQGKGHASRFAPADAALAERAAGLMGMRILRLTSPEEVALAAELPAGRVFASGKAFVPFVAKGRFERLAASPGAFTPERPVDMPAKAPGRRKGSRSAAAGGDTADGVEATPQRPGMPPADWAGIQGGSLVLAAEEGAPAIWYTATIVADRGEDLFELRWFEEGGEDLPLIVRRREHLALFPPALIETLA